MITFYVHFIVVLIVNPRDAIAANCANANKNKNNEVEQLKDFYTNGDTTRPRSRCCPYNYDPSFCKNVGDRLLCGYDRNVGGFQNDNEVELHNGCRIRDGRVECGYVNGPFKRPRRPLPTYYVDVTETPATEKNGSGAENDHDYEEVMEALKHVTSNSVHEATTRCVEIRQRVVCRES